MMKSFFKKLAFVMALAMIVTSAAPAASAFAATATALTHAHQTAKSVDEAEASYSVAIDETLDLKFYGAPENWKTLGFTWSSSNEEVATVSNPAGVVTGVADGVATITLANKANEYVASVEVTVTKTAASAVTFTVKENWTGKKVYFKVYLRDPRYCKNDKGEVIDNPNTAGETIDFNSWNVTATDIDNAAVLG